jgi:hypothetical protein
MSASVVKSEQGGGGAPKEPKTIRPFKKIDGTLQHEVNTDMDLLLKEIAKVMEIESAKGNVQGTPGPVESPMAEEEVRRKTRPLTRSLARPPTHSGWVVQAKPSTRA